MIVIIMISASILYLRPKNIEVVLTIEIVIVTTKIACPLATRVMFKEMQRKVLLVNHRDLLQNSITKFNQVGSISRLLFVT